MSMKHISFKAILSVGLFILLIVLIWSLYRSYTHKKSIQQLSAKIEEIKQVVELSSLEVLTEEIFKDTINNKVAVSRVKARVQINFDIDHLPMKEQEDTLIVMLPKEIIKLYESSDDGYQLLDVWYLSFPEDPIAVNLTTDEENEMKSRIKQQISAQMYEKGYVTRARQNAMNSLLKLFSGFRDNILIIDPFPEGRKEETKENWNLESEYTNF